MVSDTPRLIAREAEGALHFQMLASNVNYGYTTLARRGRSSGGYFPD